MKKISILFLTSIMWSLLATSCQSTPQKEDIQEYPVLAISSSSVKIMNDYPAAIRSKQDIEVYSQITGKIVEVKITEGQKI